MQLQTNYKPSPCTSQKRLFMKKTQITPIQCKRSCPAAMNPTLLYSFILFIVFAHAHEAIGGQQGTVLS
jgi:hypothetical protein